MIKKLCILTNKYPNPIEPNVLVFVQQLVWSLADKGVKCTVICPMPINLNLNYLFFPEKKIEVTEIGTEIEVLMPKYIGFGQTTMFNYNPAKITTKLFENTVEKVIKKNNLKFDAIYGHFITPAGIVSSRIGKKLDIPSFFAYGEATLMTAEHFGVEKLKTEFESLYGAIAVSTQNKEMLRNINAVSNEKISVFPNGYRKERFYPRNKAKSRNKFNLPQDKFIVSFVGSFDERKGIKRLIEAVEQLEDVYIICAGKGKMVPNSSRCLYQGSVKNEDLPYFNSAADIFVLPTLNEGSCNAIIEAMACGLPIISSNKSFNQDILDSSCSIVIDPTSISEIKNAIKKIKEDKIIQKNLASGSLLKSKNLTLDIRGDNILKFMNNTIEMNSGEKIIENQEYAKS